MGIGNFYQDSSSILRVILLGYSYDRCDKMEDLWERSENSTGGRRKGAKRRR